MKLVFTLKKIDNVIIPDVPYTNVYYYDIFKQMAEMYEPVDNLQLDDLKLDTFITKFYNNLNKNTYPPPYNLIGHSHGIYYCMEFFRQYSGKVNNIISLDGSWITKTLCEKRLENWQKKK